jgi:hypothetical protein
MPSSDPAVWSDGRREFLGVLPAPPSRRGASLSIAVTRTDDDASDAESALVQVAFAVPAPLAAAVRDRASADGLRVQEWIADALRAALAGATAPAHSAGLVRGPTRPLGHYGDP